LHFNNIAEVGVWMASFRFSSGLKAVLVQLALAMAETVQEVRATWMEAPTQAMTTETQVERW